MKKDILKKAQVIAEKTVSVAKEQMKEVKEYVDVKSEPIKIKLKIDLKKSNLEELFAEYGKACFYGRNNEGKEEILSSIYELNSEINELNELLEKKEKAVYCTNCGAEYTGDEKFCSKCGTCLKK